MRVCGRAVDTGEVITLTLSEGRITGWQSGAVEPALGNPEMWLSPGFCDLQINGYGGQDVNFGAWGTPDEVGNDVGLLCKKVARSGVALFYPTFTTHSEQSLCDALSSLARLRAQETWLQRRIPGFHLEGPYISSEDGPRGAHPLEYVRDPDWDEFCRFQEAAGGSIRLCTLAPERAGALRFIEQLTESGVVVALGHTAASPETIRDAVRAGARLSTHLGNGAHSQIVRHPNYLWEQLAHDGLYASVIPDGHHLPAATLKCIARAKGADRLIIISDAVALGGQPAGIYGKGRFEVLPSGKITLAGTPYLAGAGHLLDTCLAHTLRCTDLSLAQAIGSVTALPARLMGQEARKGHLQIGYDADLTLFRLTETGPLEICATICGGETIYLAEGIEGTS